MTPDGVLDALNDIDGDGALNFIEIDNGTNPLDGWQEEKDRMKPALAKDQETGRLRLSWSNDAQTTYHIEGAIDMGNWGTLTNKPIPSGPREGRLHYQIPSRAGLAHRYYRVSALVE
ncbi:MAG: hypothetical protein ACKVHP_23900 [Verrucomicrobiales bacterium]